jgi:hypothetical protein
MRDAKNELNRDPLENPLDALLADIAVRVQLPPGLHEKATRRYEAVRTFAEREGSPLHERVEHFYPQGSMAIDATISTRGTDDEYDLDIVAQIEDNGASPDEMLDTLAKALDGYPTAKAVERQTRCVTVRYADGMHLDVTPAVRIPTGGERESEIFHANPDEPASRHYRTSMNAFGFAEWYESRTPFEMRFATAMSQRLFEARAEADVDDVPDQVPLRFKNTATVALQILKRFRNTVYAGATGRIPPSVMMSCVAGHSAAPNTSLSDMVIRQANVLAREIRLASKRGERISIVNPVYQDDCFTDRWPDSIAQQNEFADHLTNLVHGLEQIRGGADLEETQAWLRPRFGTHVVTRSIQQFNDRVGRAVRRGQQSYTTRGGLFVPAAPAIIGCGVSAAPAVARQNTFMGGLRT